MMVRKNDLRVGMVLVAAAAMTTLAGCGGDGRDDGASSSVTAAPWAEDVVISDDVLWQVSAEGFTLTAYHMGEDTAVEDSLYSDDITNELLVAEGDPIVFINLVLTNTSDETQYIALDQPDLLATSVERPYAEQGVARVTRAPASQWRDHHVWYHSARLDSGQHRPFPLARGESSARGYIVPVGMGRQWLFVATVWVEGIDDDDVGHSVVFEQQEYTFD